MHSCHRRCCTDRFEEPAAHPPRRPIASFKYPLSVTGVYARDDQPHKVDGPTTLNIWTNHEYWETPSRLTCATITPSARRSHAGDRARAGWSPHRSSPHPNQGWAPLLLSHPLARTAQPFPRLEAVRSVLDRYAVIAALLRRTTGPVVSSPPPFARGPPEKHPRYLNYSCPICSF
jgi:hypothetical protein